MSALTRDGVDEREDVQQPATVLTKIGRGVQIPRGRHGPELQPLSGRLDQLSQRAKARIPPTMLVGGDDRLGGLGPAGQFGLGQATARSDRSQQFGRIHRLKYIVLSIVPSPFHVTGGVLNPAGPCPSSGARRAERQDRPSGCRPNLGSTEIPVGEPQGWDTSGLWPRPEEQVVRGRGCHRTVGLRPDLDRVGQLGMAKGAPQAVGGPTPSTGARRGRQPSKESGLGAPGRRTRAVI